MVTKVSQPELAVLFLSHKTKSCVPQHLFVFILTHFVSKLSFPLKKFPQKPIETCIYLIQQNVIDTKLWRAEAELNTFFFKNVFLFKTGFLFYRSIFVCDVANGDAMAR